MNRSTLAASNFSTTTCPVCAVVCSDRIADTDGGDYVRCRRCGLELQVFHGHTASQQFEKQQDTFYGGESICLTPLFQYLQATRTKQRISDLRKYLPKGRVIEVGPGNGDVMLAGRNCGYEIDGVEHSPTLAEAIRRRVGGRVKVGAFEDIDTPPASYDAYMSFHVIEHVPDIHAHLSKAHQLVRLGGYAFISTPNARSWEHRLLGRRSLNYSQAHLRLLTPECMRRSLISVGWEPIKCYTSSYLDAWMRVATSLLRAIRGRSKAMARGGYAKSSNRHGARTVCAAAEIATRPLRRVQELMGGGNELTIIARRIDSYTE